MRWQENWHLVPIGLVAGTALAIGWLDRRRTTEGHDRVHLAAMGCSYVALLTGFYVDNGPHLPLWQYLPDWSFWVLPSLVGLPIIVAAVRRRPAPCNAWTRSTVVPPAPRVISRARPQEQVSTTRCY